MTLVGLELHPLGFSEGAYNLVPTGEAMSGCIPYYSYGINNLEYQWSTPISRISTILSILSTYRE
ncbi:MAG: hypothetical protein JSV69_10320 [Chloroflexota bacterium]|nr:MAG: hypothetical protein JSV69_10320 [Chloroflexota bacterium]